MTFTFNGIFTEDQSVALAAIAIWPDCELRRVTSQMHGYVVRLPSEDDLTGLPESGEREYIQEQIDSIETEVLSLSAEFSNAFIVYLSVECFGGACGHSGLHLLGGKVVNRFDQEGGDDLAAILAPLDVRWDKPGYFEPLTRDYFERSRPDAAIREEDNSSNEFSLGPRLVLGVAAAFFGLMMLHMATSSDRDLGISLFGAFCLAIAFACFTRGRPAKFFGSVIASFILGFCAWALYRVTFGGGTGALIEIGLSAVLFGVPSALYVWNVRFGVSLRANKTGGQ